MNPRMAWLAAAICASCLMFILAPAFARDFGQWKHLDPDLSAWYRRQMQPDKPQVGCCGLADGYEADEFVTEGDQYFAVITDTRDDAPLMRPHIPPGTRIYIPPHKMKRDNSDPNPTGHGIVFIGVSGIVFCYFPPSLM